MSSTGMIISEITSFLTKKIHAVTEYGFIVKVDIFIFG